MTVERGKAAVHPSIPLATAEAHGARDEFPARTDR